MSNYFKDAIIKSPQFETHYQLDPSILPTLYALPESISQAKMKLAELSAEWDMAKAAVKEEESILMSIIQSQTNDAGKPVYSNADQREAALSEMKKGSPEWITNNQKHLAVQQKYTTARIDLEELQDQFGLLRSFIRLAAAEMELAASGVVFTDVPEQSEAKGNSTQQPY